MYLVKNVKINKNTFKKNFVNSIEIISFCGPTGKTRMAELVDAGPVCRQAGSKSGSGNRVRVRFKQKPYKKLNSTNQYMFIVYAISSETRNYIYVGLTSNLQKRFEFHNRGYEKTTAPYRPFKLIHFEELEDRTSARLREKYLKSGAGKAYLKTLK